MSLTFPLLHLPSKTFKTVFKCWYIPEIVFFSTLSKRAKCLVKTFNQNIPTIEINLSSRCKVDFWLLCTIEFGVNRQGQCDIESLTPCTLQMTRLSDRRKDISFTLPGFGVREWFEHFSFTFNQPFVSVDFYFQNQWKYTFDSVCKLLKGFSIGMLRVDENACEILKRFPVMQYLHMDKADSEPELQGADLNFVKKVLLGNIDRVEIRKTIPIDLETLLMMNSRNISSYRSLLTDKELNTFIKLWLKGTNRNLERLSLSYYYSLQRRGIDPLLNRAKNLVKSDKRNALNIEFLVCNGIYVNLYCSNTIMFGESPQQESEIESLTPCTVRVIDRWDPVEISFSVPGFNGVRDWIEHFMFIFNHPMVDVSFGTREEWKYSLESIKKILKGLPIGHLSVFENACEIVKNFPIMDSLYVDKTDSEPELQGEDLKFIKGVLIGNIARLEVNRVISMDLGTLLTINSPDITARRTSITEKELNTFLKLWLKGASRNLRRLTIKFVEHLDQSAVMNGIMYEGLNENKMYVLRYRIRKRDGTLGDIIISNNYFRLSVRP